MPLINSLNLRQNRRASLVNTLRHFDPIEVESIYLMNLILSLRSMELYPN